ncbi:mechanosensitive ion channel family protein [Tsuneonella suprasediminis]|uniref:Small-conductance mechanosensitive channel n=1 Tax=Tsuneonella suprasediminis TaxID=2306996 RepID=A0A419R0E5_9SPHN|nr:mechanosensitive ion channel [Tsuneonella suprasediminis]RJX66949.1 mechanosensitive ion channel family protein [Tsuneonella suprasediminis]UBS32230.1 mechanosensitive ion channel [Altererythrobacter sp. N1]
MNYAEVLKEQVIAMAEGFVATLPQLLIALIVLVATWGIARFISRLARKAVERARLRESLKQLVQTLVRLGVWLVGLLIAAAIVLPGFTPGSAIAGLGIGALAIGFAFQDIFENFLAGVLIMLRDKMRIGDLIEVEGVLGKVEKITLRETHVRQLSNELTIMPNSILFKNPVKILTDDTIRRNDLIVGVAYDTDLEMAERVILEAMGTVEAIVSDRPVVVYAQEFGASSVDFLVQWYAQSASRDLRKTKAEAIKAIKKALDEAGIEIPFPYVTHTFKEPVPLAPLASAN